MNAFSSYKIVAKKLPSGKYTAETFNLPPDLPWVRPEWITPVPMTADDLIRELSARGFHQIDIGDALVEADRDWRMQNDANDAPRRISNDQPVCL